VRTVELLGDAGLEEAVRAAWRRLDEAGLPSLARHRHPTNRPHLTLASVAEFPPGATEAIGRALRGLPVLVQLGGLHFFGGRAGMLAWAVDGGEALRDLQAQVWSALDGAARNPLHEPAVWTPHISLARRLSPDQVPLAGQVTGESVRDGKLDRARSYDSLTRTVRPLP